MSEGRIQLRSNVVTDPEAWNLVPGDALQRYAPSRLKPPNRPTPRQLDESMYYVPCSVCGRRINEILLQGCDDCSHGPSQAAREAARTRHENAAREIMRLRARLETGP